MTTDNGHPIVCIDPSGRPYGSSPQTLIASSPNAKKLIAFYHRLGIAIELQTDKNGQQAAIGRCPGFAAKFVAGQPASREPAAPLCFLVDDLDVTMQAVAEREGSVVEHVQPFPGGRRAVVADPDGRRMTFLERAPAMVAIPVAEAVADDESSPAVEPLSPIARQALKSGAITATVGVVLTFAVIGIYAFILWSTFDSSPRRKPQEPHAVLNLALIFLLAVTTVIQIIGKIQMLSAGNKKERIVLMIALVLESLGLLLRFGAIVMRGEPHFAALLMQLSVASQINMFLYLYFLRSVTERLGDTTTANLAYGLFLLSMGTFAFVGLLVATPQPVVLLGLGAYLCLLLLLYGAVLIRLCSIPVPKLQRAMVPQRQATVPGRRK